MQKIGQALHSSRLILIPAHNFHKEALDYQKQRNTKDAEECYRKALKVAENASQFHKSKVNQDLAALYFDYGCFLETEGRATDAEPAYQQAYDHISKAIKDAPGQPEVQNLFKDISLQYNRFLLTQGKEKQADKIFEDMIKRPAPSAVHSASISQHFSLPSPKWIPYRGDADQSNILFRKENLDLNARFERLRTKNQSTQKLSTAASLLSYTLPKQNDPIRETRHLAWCIQSNDASKEDKAIWLQKAKQVIEQFKSQNKSLAHVQEIVALSSIDHLQLHREITNALLEELGPQKKYFLNLFLLRGVSVMMLQRCRFKIDPHVAGDCITLVQTLLNLLSSIHIYRNPEQTITLLQTLSLAIDWAISHHIEGVDRVEFETPLLNALNRFDNEKKYPELAWLVEYIRQMLMHLPNDETLLESLQRRMKVGLLGIFQATAFGLSVVGTQGIELAAAIIQPDKILDIYSSFEEALGGIKWLRRARWYGELCFIDLLIGHGEFDLLEKHLKKNQKKWDEPFLRGLCDRLERLACDSTDQGDSALKLLKALELGEVEWARPSIPSIENYATQCLNRVALMWPTPSFDEMEQYGYAPPAWHPFWFAQPKDGLWQEVSAHTTSLEELHKILKDQHLAALEQNQALQEALQLYVEQRGRVEIQNKIKTLDPLLKEVKELLLANKKLVILLTGNIGVGKTTFCRKLEKQLWDEVETYKVIPLLICLPSIDKPEHDLIAKALKEKGFSETEIQVLKNKQKFVFILDGYDEIRQIQNLYLSNHINQVNSWQGHMVINCGSEYLGQNYHNRFQPDPQDKNTLFHEVAIEPLTNTDPYVEKYVNWHQTGWTVQNYKEAIERLHLKSLVSNPFLLRVALEALPRLENDGKRRTDIQLRMDLYDEFIRRKYEGGQESLSAQDLKDDQRELFIKLCDDGFAEHGLRFVQDLAVHIYTENEGNPIVEYSMYKDEGSWKDTFFAHTAKLQLLRNAWPLIRSGNRYRFIHKSLLEYFAARALFKSFDACMTPKIRSRRGSDASVYSFENQPALSLQTRQDVWLAPKHWVNDRGVIRWLTKRVEKEHTFKDKLLQIIERSKTDVSVRQAAANAITILVKAGVPFNGADFKGIQIPGADLSYGFFDNAQFQSVSQDQQTDLRRVWMQGARLCDADFRGAKMHGAQFGELPSLQFDNKVNAYCCSPHWFAITRGKKISLYQPLTLQKKKAVVEHEKVAKAASIALSSDERHLVSVDTDKTEVLVWDLNTPRAQPHSLKTEYQVTSLALSSDGHYVVFGSTDKKMWVWDVNKPQDSKDRLHCLGRHDDEITSIALPSDGLSAISGSKDKTVRVWDLNADDGKFCTHKLEGHDKAIISVALSPERHYAVSASKDHTVRLWDLNADDGKRCIHILNGKYPITSMALSSDGRYVVFSGADKIVRVWNLSRPNDKPHILAGHKTRVTSIALSPDEHYAFSGSKEMMRVWDLHALSWASHTLAGHDRGITSVALSPDGRYIVSGDKDKSIYIWDLLAPVAKPHPFNEHHRVSNIALLQNDQYIVCSSTRKTVQVWDLVTASSVPLYILPVHDGEWVTSLALSSDGRYVVSGRTDKKVHVWNLNKPDTEPRRLEGHTGKITSIALSSDGLSAISGSTDKRALVWDLKGVEEKGVGDINTTKARHILKGHQQEITSVALSSDGLQAISGSKDHMVRVWNLNGVDATPRCILEGHKDEITSISLSPDGLYVASGSKDKTVRVWDITAEKCLVKIKDFNEYVHALDWKKMGDLDYLVTGSGDKAIRWWQLIKENGQWRAILRWTSAQQSLILSNANIEGVQGLSPRSKLLLKQRGTKGNPAPTTYTASTRAAPALYV